MRLFRERFKTEKPGQEVFCSGAVTKTKYSARPRAFGLACAAHKSSEICERRRLR